MVTTDYQVVQGDIFHIRDVTLFQWGNTCSTRYKLHERAYTGRHVCCIARGNALAKQVRARVCVCSRASVHASRGLAPGKSLDPRSSRTASLPIPFPRSRLKIIPTFGDYKNVRPLFRENDSLTDHRRHSTPTRYPFSRLERRLLTGAQTLLGVLRQSWNFETTRPKG